MIREYRLPKPDDQENIYKAHDYLWECINAHPEIESTLWVGALFSTLVAGFVKEGCAFTDFENEIKQMLRHYKNWFDN